MARRRRIAAAAVLALVLAGCHAHRATPAGTPTVPRPTVSPTLPAAGGLTGRIAYNGVDGDIWVMDADGTHRRQVTHSGTGGDLDPSWSPDGSRIAFSGVLHQGDGEDHLFVMRPDGAPGQGPEREAGGRMRRAGRPG